MKTSGFVFALLTLSGIPLASAQDAISPQFGPTYTPPVITLPPPPGIPATTQPPQAMTLAPQVMTPPAAAYKPLAPVVPMPKQYYMGRGILGQPKLYVPRQPVRNFFRYLTL